MNRRLSFAALGLALVLVLAGPAVHAQSSAINGNIEGIVRDSSGGILPGVSVTVTNVDTGALATVTTNERGVYRATLLPLGAYRVSAAIDGFKRSERGGVSLLAGQTAVVDFALEVGSMTESVEVTVEAPLVDTARIEQGRTLSNAEIKTLPLTSRNPYNFALLQPGVVGFETNEFGVPRLTANGALLRVNYQVDGSNNTQKDRAGLRQMPMSEIMIREVKVVTSGYAPEFGQTMGLVYNAITPSGTNKYRGQASYRMQRESFVEMPFFATGAKPPTEVNLYTADLGGPLVKDKTHFFVGGERVERDLSGLSVITISAANQALLGLTEPQYMPRVATTNFAIAKIDHMLNAKNRVSARYMYFDNVITNNIGGGLTSVQRGTDFTDTQHSAGLQLISTISPNVLNELRLQYATRAQARTPGSQAGTGPAVNIAGVANIGGPIASLTDAGFGFTQDVLQINDSLTWIRGAHSFKAGIDIQNVKDTRTSPSFQLYTFPSAAAYLAARSGANPRGYTSFQQYFGEPNLDFSSNLYGAFIQDDWRVRDNVKVIYGLRYDYYAVPDPDPTSVLESSKSFKKDKNNVAPRLGVVWALDDSRRTVLRANTGLMYDQALLAIYEQTLINNGTNRRASASFSPTTAGAPAFPAVLSAGTGATPNTAFTVDPNFEIARSWQSNVQLERALGDQYSVAIGATYVTGSSLPVVNNINLINPTGTLADGRPIYSTTVSAATRRDPRFNVINSVESVGESTYKALTLQFTRRATNGVQFDFAYTLGKSEDNAPITGTLSVQGDAGRADPSNLDRDLGPNVLDQRHTFTGSIVATPKFELENGTLNAILNNNVLGIALQFASGIPINIRANRELNNDGVASDRPIGVARNSITLPSRQNIDFRYSRQFSVGGDRKLEVIGEVKNLLNKEQWSSVNATVTVNVDGTPTAALPTKGKDLVPTGGYEQRQFQLGFRFIF
jgi:hypothetical protein